LSRFLEKLDRDYLSRYDKKEITIEDRKYVPWTGERTETYIYPVTKDTSEENGSIVSFAVSLGDISAYDLELMNVVGALLTAESSVLKQKMMEEFPNAVLDVNVQRDLRLPVMTFLLRDAAKGDAEKFRRVLEDAVDEICREGLNKDLVDSIVRDQQIQTVLSAEQPGGINTCDAFALYWSHWRDRLAYLDAVRAVENLREEADKGTLNQLLEKYLKAPKQAVLVEVDPSPGQRELLDEEFEAKLAAMKAGMSDDEIARMIESTKEFRDWGETSA
jgi:Zn-dependent M16 (insulinase) family peptidase